MEGGLDTAESTFWEGDAPEDDDFGAAFPDDKVILADDAPDDEGFAGGMFSLSSGADGHNNKNKRQVPCNDHSSTDLTEKVFFLPRRYSKFFGIGEGFAIASEMSQNS